MTRKGAGSSIVRSSTVKLPFSHRLQQGRLGAGGSPVDLIGQHDLGQDGPWAKLELARLLVVVMHSGDIGGHQVGCALDPSEGTLEGLGQAAGQGSLADAGYVFHQDVAPAEHRRQGQLDHLTLAHEHLFDVGLDAAGHLGQRGCGQRVSSLAKGYVRLPGCQCSLRRPLGGSCAPLLPEGL